MDKFDNLGFSIGNYVTKYRWLVIAAVLLLTFAMASGAKNLGFDTNYRVFFSKDNPQLLAFDELQNVYTKTDNAIYVLRPKEGDIFQPRVLQAIKDFTEGSWKLPYSTRVDSLSNFQHTYAVEDDLTVTDLVDANPLEMGADEITQIKEVALSEPLLVGKVISPDGKTTGINITFYFDENDPAQIPITVAAARDLLEEMQAKYPEIEMRPSGVVFMNNAFSESSQHDLKTLIPLMYGALIIAMLFLFRSFTGTFSTVLVIAFSAAAAMGLGGWLGLKLTPISSTAPTVILTLAIADSVHIIISMYKAMQSGMAKKEAIIESLRINLQPVFLTSLTTAIGFLSLNFSDAPPFHDLGNTVAAGVMLAFVYSVTLLPAMLAILPFKPRLNKSTGKKEYVEKFADMVIGNVKKIFLISVVVVIFLGVMISKIELNDQFVQYFDYTIPFRGDSEYMMEHLTGIYQLEYSIRAKEAQGITDPEYLRIIDKFSSWMREQQEVMNVYTVTDIFKRLNKNMHGDDEAWYRIPENREMAAQYLLLYEFSLPFGLDLNDRINVDKSATRLTVTLDDMSTKEVRAFKDKTENWLKENAPEHMQAEATSPVVMFAYISERNINSMMIGNIVALLLISLSIMIALKSFRIGLYSLVPNLAPAIMGFGIWGIFVGQVNMAVAITAAISLGIIVDDTVHFLSKYLRARREKGMDAAEAVKYSFRVVGTALVITSVILVVGFSILILSAFEMNEFMGMLTAITITCALVADFFLLPSLLMLLDNKKGKYDE